jgi:hypothetical protein
MTIYYRPSIAEIERALYIFLYDRTIVMTKAPPQPTRNDAWRFIIGFKLCVRFLYFSCLLAGLVVVYIGMEIFESMLPCAFFFVCPRK